MPNNKGFIGISATLIIVVALSIGIYMYWQNRTDKTANTIMPTPVATMPDIAASEAPTPNPFITQIAATKKEYTNTRYGISFAYPSSWAEGTNTSISKYGDLLSLKRRGTNNIPDSELSDGINFAVSYPTDFEGTLTEYAQEISDTTQELYDSRPQISDVQLSGLPAKHILYCKEDGSCSEIYLAIRDGMIIEFIAFYAGPNKDKDATDFRDLINSLRL